MEQLLHCASVSVLHTSHKSKVTWSAICPTNGRRCTSVGVCEIANAYSEVCGVARGKKRREKVRVGFDTPDTPKLFRNQWATMDPIRQYAQHDCRQSHEQRGSDDNRGAARDCGFTSIEASEQKTVDGVGENNPEQDRPEAEDERTRVLPRRAGARIHERAARRNVGGVVGGCHPHDKRQKKNHRNVEQEDEAEHPCDPSRRLAETACGCWFWVWR